MSIFANIIFGAEGVDPARSVHWLWPEQAELIYGTISSLLIFGLLWKFAGPAIKKAMSDRTERIQNELDASATAKTEAEAEAADIRQAAGDIDGERQRLFAEADAQAAALLVDGRESLEHEVADLARPSRCRYRFGRSAAPTTSCGPRSPACRTPPPSGCWRPVRSTTQRSRT